RLHSGSPPRPGPVQAAARSGSRPRGAARPQALPVGDERRTRPLHAVRVQGTGQPGADDGNPEARRVRRALTRAVRPRRHRMNRRANSVGLLLALAGPPAVAAASIGLWGESASVAAS